MGGNGKRQPHVHAAGIALHRRIENCSIFAKAHDFVETCGRSPASAFQHGPLEIDVLAAGELEWKPVPTSRSEPRGRGSLAWPEVGLVMRLRIFQPAWIWPAPLRRSRPTLPLGGSRKSRSAAPKKSSSEPGVGPQPAERKAASPLIRSSRSVRYGNRWLWWAGCDSSFDRFPREWPRDIDQITSAKPSSIAFEARTHRRQTAPSPPRAACTSPVPGGSGCLGGGAENGDQRRHRIKFTRCRTNRARRRRSELAGH